MIPARNTDETPQKPILDRPLKIAIFGLDANAVKKMDVAFHNYGENCATIVEEQQAEAAIFDFDSIDGKRTWMKFKAATPDVPTILITSRPLDITDSYILTKPLRVGKFVSIFQEIQDTIRKGGTAIAPASSPAINTDAGNKTVSPVRSVTDSGQSKPSATQSAIDKARAGNNASAPKAFPQYSPKKYLQSVITEAFADSIEHNIAIDLAVNIHDEWETLTIFPQLKKVDVELSEQQLKYISTTPLYCLDTKLIKHSAADSKKLADERRDDPNLVSFESFLWSVAMWTSEGRLPKQLEQSACYQLRRWPNLTRVPKIAGAMSMSALLSDKPFSIPLFLKVSGMDTHNVLSFLSAANAIGILKTAIKKDSSDEEVPAKEHQKRGIFMRILDKLKTHH